MSRHPDCADWCNTECPTDGCSYILCCICDQDDYPATGACKWCRIRAEGR